MFSQNKYKVIKNSASLIQLTPIDKSMIPVNFYLVKDGRPDGEFSDQTFNSFLPTDWEETKHGELVKELIETDIFEKSEKTLGNKNWYKIKENPHY